METNEIIEFLQMVQKAIQTNYPSSKESKAALEELLNKTDELHISLTGKPIVIRGYRNLLDALVSHPLSKISK